MDKVWIFCIVMCVIVHQATPYIPWTTHRPPRPRIPWDILGPRCLSCPNILRNINRNRLINPRRRFSILRNIKRTGKTRPTRPRAYGKLSTP